MGRRSHNLVSNMAWTCEAPNLRTDLVSIPVSSDGKPITVRLGLLQPICTAAGDSEDFSSLLLRATPEALETLESFDKAALQTAIDNRKGWFGERDPENSYKSPIRRADNYPAAIRLKVRNTGSGATRIWDMNTKKPRGPPEDWRRCSLDVIVRVQGIWIRPEAWGYNLYVEHALVHEEECPF